jgi:uncharacterized membrane protein YhaH (DUF805 family)
MFSQSNDDIVLPLMKIANTPFGKEPAAPFFEGSVIPRRTYFKLQIGAGVLAVIVGLIILVWRGPGFDMEGGRPPFIFGAFATFVVVQLIAMIYANASWHSRRINDLGFPGIIIFLLIMGGMSGFFGSIWTVFTGIIEFPSESRFRWEITSWAVAATGTIIGLATKSIPGRDNRKDSNRIG